MGHRTYQLLRGNMLHVDHKGSEQLVDLRAVSNVETEGSTVYLITVTGQRIGISNYIAAEAEYIRGTLLHNELQYTYDANPCIVMWSYKFGSFVILRINVNGEPDYLDCPTPSHAADVWADLYEPGATAGVAATAAGTRRTTNRKYQAATAFASGGAVAAAFRTAAAGGTLMAAAAAGVAVGHDAPR